MSRRAGEYFGAALRELEAKRRTVGLVMGCGHVLAGRLRQGQGYPGAVRPRDRHTTFAGDTSGYPTRVVLGKCLREGRSAGGYLPNTLRIGASLTVSKADMDKAIDALDYALDHLDESI